MEPRIDLTAPENRPDPYPIYAELRRRRICQIDPGGFWAVSRYEDVVFVLKSHEIFSSSGFRPAWEPAWVGENPLAHSLVTMDGEEHGRIRQIAANVLQVLLTDKRFPAAIQEHANMLADRIAQQGEAEFMSEFATPLQTRVLTKILGFDPALERQYKKWTRTVVAITPHPPPEERAREIRESIAELKSHIQLVIEERSRNPSDDLVGQLVAAAVPPKKIVAICTLAMASSMEPPSYLMSNTVRLLAQRPDIFEQVKHDRRLMPRLVDEILRWDGPIPGMPRMAMQDVELAGQFLPKGSCVYAAVAAANRDERRFDNADRFDLMREDGDGALGHLSFGAGVHRCPGNMVGRHEVQLGLGALLDRFQRFEIDPAAVEWNRALTGRGTLKLPVRFIP